MARHLRTTALGALLGALALGIATPAAAFDPNPDWPCVQRKVTRLSWGQMWSGPPLPEQPVWREDAEVRSLVARLSARRTPMEEVERLVADLGPSETRSRDERLVLLFAGTFAEIDRERTRIVEGIERYARKQRALSERIDEDRAEIAELEASVEPDDFDALDRLEERQDKLTWDTRIYDERRQSLTYVCETPVILEKRIFAISRIIQGELGA